MKNLIMNNVRLVDFTETQLQKLLTAVEAEQRHLLKLNGYSDDDLLLIRVQILTAIGFLANRKETLSN